MYEFLSIFLNSQFILLGLGIVTATFVFRTVLEYFILNNPRMPGNSQSKLWRDGILILFPIMLGVIFPFVAKNFAYPAVIHDEVSKFLFSSVAGLLSPILYRMIKAAISNLVDRGNSGVSNAFPVAPPTPIQVNPPVNEPSVANPEVPADLDEPKL